MKSLQQPVSIRHYFPRKDDEIARLTKFPQHYVNQDQKPCRHITQPLIKSTCERGD